jgi:hypothetical protein
MTRLLYRQELESSTKGNLIHSLEFETLELQGPPRTSMNFLDLKKLREDRLRPPSLDHSEQANRTIEMR